MTHTNRDHITPPLATPQVLNKAKSTYKIWISLHRDFPKVERLGLGNKIEVTFLSVLEYIFASIYLISDQKILILSKTIAKLDQLKFFMQLAWESKLISTDKYTSVSMNLEEIGRQLGGWRKGLQAKTPRT
jgi:hypothetical protein